ncbi:MAG: hypothetical protein CME24_01905 [Gemmatimonadetes bacterium]|nr:hypothetical protein [Gemmatimonadota bacterium]
MRHLVLFAALVFALGGTLEEYWPIFISSMGVAPYSLGLFLSLTCGVQALASFFAHRFVDMPSRILFSALAVSGVGLFIAARSMHVAGVLLILFFVFVFQVIDIIYDARLQAAIPSDHRATVSSVKSFVAETGGDVVVLAMGLIVTGSLYSTGFWGFGVAVAGVGLVYLLVSARLPLAENHR